MAVGRLSVNRETSEKAKAGPFRKRPSMAAATYAGIEDVIAEVGAQVDTGDHHVRQFLQQAVQAQVRSSRSACR